MDGWVYKSYLQQSSCREGAECFGISVVETTQKLKTVEGVAAKHNLILDNVMIGLLPQYLSVSCIESMSMAFVCGQ